MGGQKAPASEAEPKKEVDVKSRFGRAKRQDGPKMVKHHYFIKHYVMNTPHYSLYQ